MKALIVEDEVEVLDLLALHLKREGLEVSRATDGDQALTLLDAGEFDLLVLDWMLPGPSGVEICRRVRASKEIRKQPAILLVTARVEPTDIISGLEAGADDYVTKPFEIPVLVARIRALQRRLTRPEAERVELGSLIFDATAHEVSCGGKEISLTTSEFKLLKALLENRGRVMTRERLIDLVQGEDISVTGRTVDTHVYGLRQKLGSCAELIETIRGVGYRIAN